MDIEGIMLSEISQTEKDTVLFYLHEESKKQMNKQQNRNRVRDTENIWLPKG